MAKKISKNARIAERLSNTGGGKDFVKVVKSIKDPETGKYSYQELMIHKDEVKSYFAKSN